MSATTESPSAVRQTSNEAATKYLTFKLGAESFGIKVVEVREIIRLVAITAMPGAPAYVRGVINLRGKIIPVVDLRLRLGMPGAEATEQACIVVVQVSAGQGRRKSVGAIVDAVEEVVNIAAADIEAPPSFGSGHDTESILGMAKIKGVVKSLLDIDELLCGCREPQPALEMT